MRFRRKKSDDLDSINKFDMVTKTLADLAVQQSGPIVYGRNFKIKIEAEMPKLTDECRYNDHSHCGHVLWATTTSDTNEPHVEFCTCRCHTTKELRKAIEKLAKSRVALKRDRVPAE